MACSSPCVSLLHVYLCPQPSCLSFAHVFPRSLSSAPPHQFLGWGGLGPGWSLLGFSGRLRVCQSLHPYRLLGWAQQLPVPVTAPRLTAAMYQLTPAPVATPRGGEWLVSSLPRHPCRSLRWGVPEHSRPTHPYLLLVYGTCWSG